jgi:hypothetical protein
VCVLELHLRAHTIVLARAALRVSGGLAVNLSLSFSLAETGAHILMNTTDTREVALLLPFVSLSGHAVLVVDVYLLFDLSRTQQRAKTKNEWGEMVIKGCEGTYECMPQKQVFFFFCFS